MFVYIQIIVDMIIPIYHENGIFSGGAGGGGPGPGGVMSVGIECTQLP